MNTHEQNTPEQTPVHNEPPVPAPQAAPTPQPVAADRPVRDIKFAFLSLLIVGAAATGLTAVVALLLGGFNDYIGRALLTILVLVTHALIGLAIISTVTTAYLKRSLIADTILTVAAANVITVTLGIWHVIPANIAWHIVGLYFVLIGGAFAVTWFIRSLIGVRQPDAIIKAAIAMLLVFIASLVPWVVTEHPTFPSIYYRAVGAVVIIIATLMVIASIVRHIYRSRGQGFKVASAFMGLSPLVIVMYSVIGAITIFVWIAGLTGFSIDALGRDNASMPHSSPYDDSQLPNDQYNSDDSNGDSDQFDGSGNAY